MRVIDEDTNSVTENNSLGRSNHALWSSSPLSRLVLCDGGTMGSISSSVPTHFLGHCHHQCRYQQSVHTLDTSLRCCGGCCSEPYTCILRYNICTFWNSSTTSHCSISHLQPQPCHIFYHLCIIPNYLHSHYPCSKKSILLKIKFLTH